LFHRLQPFTVNQATTLDLASERASNEQDKDIFGCRGAFTVWADFCSNDESDYSGRNIELDSERFVGRDNPEQYRPILC
jgi:hypothetical protein